MTRPPFLARWAARALMLCLVAGVSPVWAQAQDSAHAVGAPDEGQPRIEATLLTDVSQVKAGDAFRVGVRFQMDPGWHIYWKNPGDAGLATEVSWDTPGVTVGALQWPFPSTFRTPDGFIVTHGYGEEVLLFAEAQASTQAQGALTLSAIAEVLVCEINCIPARLSLRRTLPVGPSTELLPAETAVFEAARAQVPSPAEGGPARLEVVLAQTPLNAGQPFSGTLKVQGLPSHRGEADFFIPERVPGLGSLKIVAGADPSSGVFRIEGETLPQLPEGMARLRGVLRLGSAREGFSTWAVDLPLAPFVPSKAAPVAAAGVVGPSVAQVSPLSLGLMLLFAFLGGALLNLMPCVFPVLALKAYGFSRMVSEERGRVGWHALAYVLGIEAAMLALALSVIAVRGAGRQVGWGFQFQEPLFVAAVSGILVAFALNLFGVFHVGGGGGGLARRVDERHGFLRSAGEGVLAVVLATPCSAPLLGTAVGFALAKGPFTILAVFLLLGLGLGLPFCALVLIPGLARRLPKPGEWMEHAKHLLGFALLGTAVWLLWVLGGLAGVGGMAQVLSFLMAVALASWVWGRTQNAEGTKRWVGLTLSLAVVAFAGVKTLRFEAPKEAVAQSGLSGARPWDEAAVAAALKKGQPVFIDFTADWCLTCKFNERSVLSQDEVLKAFAQRGVAVFVGDWTRRDERIGKKLAEHGRAGVPLYLMIHPQRPAAPEVLPELLTTATVLEALDRATQAQAAKL